MNIISRILNNVNPRHEFMPFLKKMDIDGISGDFFYSTQQAQQWYDPLKPYAKLEYEWVIKNIDLKNKKIIDGGAHHGQYSVVLSLGANKPSRLISVDPFPMNCSITKVNMSLNQLDSEIVQKAISTKVGTTSFTTESNGRISSTGDMKVETSTLEDIMEDVQIVKLDIEGHEFEVIPHSINKLKNIETWIVEIHPDSDKRPDDIINIFLENNYEIYWVNRKINEVEKYKLGTIWDIHSTIFALKSRKYNFSDLVL